MRFVSNRLPRRKSSEEEQDFGKSEGRMIKTEVVQDDGEIQPFPPPLTRQSTKATFEIKAGKTNVSHCLTFRTMSLLIRDDSFLW